VLSKVSTLVPLRVNGFEMRKRSKIVGEESREYVSISLF